MNLQRRESLSAETAKYIEHLESELAATQTQLSSMTSPTVMQARSLKMRALNAETRTLHEELAQWESKFHERVQEEIEHRTRIEAGLKSRIRVLETETEEYAQKVRELKHQLEASAASLNATETANVELERRLEVVTGLLASPKKEEASFTFTNDRPRHSRQRSMLTRFPTTGSLLPPAKLLPTTGPVTPPCLVPVDLIPRKSELEARQETMNALIGTSESVFPQGIPEDGPPVSECGTSSKRSSFRLSWSTPESVSAGESVAPSTGGGRPSRRMRRFHAGSVMPKPLLLPTANCLMSIPASAPPLEQNQTPPSFPFPELASMRNLDNLISPLPGRRRASTCVDELLMAQRRASQSPLASSPPLATMEEPTILRLPSPDYISSEKTLRDFSSLGSTVGRNLFEELQRVKMDELPSSSNTPSSRPLLQPSPLDNIRHVSSSTVRSTSATHEGFTKRCWTLHQRSISAQTTLTHSRPASSATKTKTLTSITPEPATSKPSTPTPTPTIPMTTSPYVATFSTSSRAITTLFTDLWRQPYNAARTCLSRAGSLTARSGNVHRIQYWLIHFLLGPMMTRRIMAGSLRRHKRGSGKGNGNGNSGPETPLTLLERSSASASVSSSRSTTSSSSLCSTRNTRTSRRQNDAIAGSSAGRGDGHEHDDGEGEREDEGEGNVQSETNSKVGPGFSRHSPWLWLRFSLTLAVAIGAAIRDGPGSVMAGEGADADAGVACCGKTPLPGAIAGGIDAGGGSSGEARRKLR